MKNIKYLYIAIIFLISSCTDTININTDNSEPRPVISSILSIEEKFQEVRVSSTAPFFDNKPNPKISGAIVKVHCSNGSSFEFKEDSNEEGLYKSTIPFGVSPGLNYKLSVEVDFNKDGVSELYEASTEVYKIIPVDSIKIQENKILDNSFFSVNLYMKNPPGPDYFISRFLVNNKLVTNRIIFYGVFHDENIGDADPHGVMIYRFRNEKDRDDFNDKEQKDIIFVQSGDSVTLLLSKIDKSYYDFINQCQDEYEGENPFFGGPSSNIITNFSNGAVGYFSAYGYSTAKAVVP